MPQIFFGRKKFMLKGKSVVVGVCGGIAAYKIVEVVSRLVKLEADVDVVMTENATRFVTPLTFQSITHRPVITGMFNEPKVWDIQHISLAKKADLVLIAPATANILGKVACGIADDMLSTTIMATKAPVLFVPAMNHNMYDNPIVQDNINRLTGLGYIFMQPESGRMAEGTFGKGRLPEPEFIVNRIEELLIGKKDMACLKVLITAGPTREAIDPVRYISNHSSGKMGYAIASAAVERGADVCLVSGPVSLSPPEKAVLVNVVSAQQMYDEVLKRYGEYDIIVMVAAVADYRCEVVARSKIKKSEDRLLLNFIKNPDIAKELGRVKGNRLLIGFSAETENLLDNATHILSKKNMDMIVANDITMEGAGFGTDTNIVRIIKRDGMIELPIMSKGEVAHRILDEALLIKKA